MNGGVEIGHGAKGANDFFAEFIGFSDDFTRAQAASGEHSTEGNGLMTAPAAGIELRGTAELGGDNDESAIEEFVALARAYCCLTGSVTTGLG